MKKKTILSAVLSLMAMTLFGCGGGGGGNGTTPPPVAGSTTISGVAAKGPISGGTVKVFAISNGQVDRTAEIGSGTTDGSGAYKVTIAPDKKPAGAAVLVEVTSGTFTDEATGAAGVILKTPLQAAVSSVAFVDGAKIAVTPLTHLAVKQVEGIGAFSDQEIDDANAQIGRFFQVEDIIKSQPFDSTKDAPAGASDDQKKYAGALGVFSQLCDSRRGANKLEDALDGILNTLGNELNDNGGFVGQTLIDFNKAIADFDISGKNKGGIAITKIVFKGGVLQLQTAGALPANTEIQGLDIMVTIPAGVTINLDAVTGAATGEAATGVVVPVSTAVAGTLSSAKFTPAVGTAPATLHIVFAKVKPGFDVGEFAHLEFGLTAGTPFPAKADFAVTVISIIGGSKTDPNASFSDLVASGITVGQKSISGL